MSKKHKKRFGPGWILLIIVMALVNFGLLIKLLIQDKNIALLNPKGFIAQEQYDLLVYIVTVLAVVFIPTLIVCYFIAWKYRESNTKAVHAPTASRNKLIVAGMWIVPAVILVVLASVMIPATHQLAPQQTIASGAEPLKIQVVAMRWKWLFLYPDQNIATVNFVQIPVNTQVTFELTADETPMSSFWIPNLGGQLYAMTGHVNPINLMATESGDYPGSTPEINGKGFAGMKFTARASSTEDFNQWVKSVQDSENQLDTTAYEKLVKPSEKNPVALYGTYEKTLYDKVVMKYSGSTEGHAHH